MRTLETETQPSELQPQFDMGKLCVTRDVFVSVSEEDVFRCMSRHSQRDWGDLDAEDRESNERALRTGARLFSAYHLSDGRKAWVITDAEDDDGRRLATTMLLPDEY